MLPHDMWSHTGAGNPEAFDNGHLVTLLQWMGIGFDKQLFVASRLDGQALGSGVVRPECARAVGLTSTALVALTIQYSRMKVEFAESGVCDVRAWTCVDSRVDSGEGCDACQCVRGHAWGGRAGSRRTARYGCMHVWADRQDGDAGQTRWARSSADTCASMWSSAGSAAALWMRYELRM